MLFVACGPDLIRNGIGAPYLAFEMWVVGEAEGYCYLVTNESNS